MNYKEYIIPIGDKAKEFDEMFIGVIRKQPELIRCKDCKHWYCYGYETFCSELGIYDTDKESYCSYAKRE